MSATDNKKISELSAAGTLTGAELVPIVQGGVTVRTTASALSSGAGVVSGPGSSTSGDIVTWSGTGGTVLADSGTKITDLAPGNADYLVKTANGTLTAERVVTDTASVVWDWGTSGQAKATVSAGATSGLAPSDVDYLVKTASANLSAERVVTDTSTVTWDFGTSGQAKANVVSGTAVVADGDKGDIVVSSLGTVWSFDTAVVTAAAKTVLDDTSISDMRTTLGLAIGTNVLAYSSHVLFDNATANLTAGFTSTANNIGTVSSGTTTPAASTGNLQRYINGGAHTLAPPSSNDTQITVLITNNGSAGAITTSGFTKVTGSSFTTTNTDKFMCFITVINSISLLNVVAMQ